MKLPAATVSPLRLIAAAITPHTTHGEVDHSSLARLVGHLWSKGIEEIFVIGSTGEASLLNEPTRLSIIETSRRSAGEAVIHAGISGTGPDAAIRNAKEAALAGADLAVLMSPYFMLLDDDQLAWYCMKVADASPIPVTVYHHLRMPTAFTIPVIERLAKHGNIIGLKDTNGGDANRTAAILAATAGTGFQFLQGVEKLVLPTLEAGGHGCVVAQACIAPSLYRSLFDAWADGRTEEALACQQKISAVWEIFSLPEVRKSFSHFLHTLKLPLHQQGIISTTAGALPAHFDESYDALIMDFLKDRLEP